MYLVPGQFVPVSLLLFDQFDDGLVGLHFPAAPVHDDVSSKFQLSSVGPTVHAAPEHNTETDRDVIKLCPWFLVFSVCLSSPGPHSSVHLVLRSSPADGNKTEADSFSPELTSVKPTLHFNEISSVLYFFLKACVSSPVLQSGL